MTEHVHYSADDERALLGAILVTNGAPLGELRRLHGLRSEHFYLPKHGTTYSAMCALQDRQEAVDALTVCAELERSGAFEGHMAYVHSLPSVTVTAHFASYAKRVLELAVLRQKQDGYRRGIEAVGREDWQAMADAEALLVTDTQRERRTTREERQHRLYEYAERGEVEAWPWPFEKLNELTAGGLRREQFTVLAGSGGHGKSVLLDQILERATEHGAHAMLYVNEMSVEERDLRFVSRRANIPFKRLMQANLRDDDRERYLHAIEALPFDVYPCAGMSAQDIALDIRLQKPDVVGIDLLNKIPHRETKDIDENVRILTAAASQAGCHIVACQHLNQGRWRDAYPPEPALRDIRGSGQIADLANNVVFIYRREGEVYDEETRKGMPSGDPGDRGLIHFAKVRNGIPGRLEVTFQGSRMRFLAQVDGAVGLVAA